MTPDRCDDKFDFQFALNLDQEDPLKAFRQQFCIPYAKDVSSTKRHGSHEAAESGNASDAIFKPDERCVYLCGNSLGLQPLETRTLLLQELDVWSQKSAASIKVGG
jgi:kynureninase